jgi:hypothetical protein
MGSSADESGIDSFIIFLDENHCRNPHLLQTLADSGTRFESHLNHFEPGTEGTTWLPQIGRHGWCLLTTDKRIRKRPLEREAVRAHAVRMFYFSTNSVSGSEMGSALRHALPRMRQLFPGSVATIYSFDQSIRRRYTEGQVLTRPSVPA